MIAVEELSIIGRIHEMIGEMQAQGRMSCAEVSAIWALTMHPDLPDYFRREATSPTFSASGSGYAIGVNLPAARAHRLLSAQGK